MTGADIIKLKDRIHTKWFELQNTKREDKKHAFLQKPIYDEIVRLGHQALDMLKQIAPTSLHIKRIEFPLHEIERQSWVVDDITYMGAPPKPYYVMEPKRGKDIITRDINMLANAVHHGGMSVIEYTGVHGGCLVPEGLDLRSLNTGVLKYCEGVLSLGGRRGHVRSGGDTVEHRPGSAASHSAVLQFTPTEKGSAFAMAYVESGDASWRLRQQAISDYISKMGGHCTSKGLESQCKVAEVSDDEVLKLALVISQLKDVDLLGDNCIPLAFELIERQADDLKKLEPKEDIWVKHWTRINDFDQIIDCVEPHSTEEGRTAKEILARRLNLEIEQLADELNYVVAKIKERPCIASTYTRLSDVANNPDNMRRNCTTLKTETSDPFGWCFDSANAAEKDIIDAAKSLIDRCPPEPIILGSEASSSVYGGCQIDEISRICQLAENQDCLDIIKQVDAREAAGIKPGKLPLTFERENG